MKHDQHQCTTAVGRLPNVGEAAFAFDCDAVRLWLIQRLAVFFDTASLNAIHDPFCFVEAALLRQPAR
ncbi:hypothetical protein APX70_200571 [Pseudomonas syringae pv. maculicola]|uniref:Uncharacterized protein n=1 Tax=Pseudomonas syringae pv. maculicola TaxID=59511 RepID=A0A3M3A9H9_PSEYM|nr:hypothetical protein APX70_200571 [Pseudomonas syringae pv. maculicola]